MTDLVKEALILLPGRIGAASETKNCPDLETVRQGQLFGVSSLVQSNDNNRFSCGSGRSAGTLAWDILSPRSRFS
jgi:hypothetical protein